MTNTCSLAVQESPLSTSTDTAMIYTSTERLILRSWQPEDLPLFARMNKDMQVMKYFPTPLKDAETEAFYNRINNEFAAKGFGLYAIELKSTGEFIGYVGLHEIAFDADFTPGTEIGWRPHTTTRAMRQKQQKQF